MEKHVEWLLEGAAWVEYLTRQDLLNQPAHHPDVQQARARMLADPLIQGLVADLANLHITPLNSHKSAAHPLHKLSFLAEVGLTADDAHMRDVVKNILAHRSPDGVFQTLMNISVHYGGTGKDEFHWVLCDAPLWIFILSRLGLGKDERVQAALDVLHALVRQNGFPCAGAPEGGKFRGPGRKDDPCPYVNLLMLKTLATQAEWRQHPSAHLAAESLLACWQRRSQEHPYMFFMGTDFCKLKAPLVWYDLVHVLDVLTRFPWLKGDARLDDMLAVLRAKADGEGRFTPESIWTAWKEWDFGQKRLPSQGLTLFCQRILNRAAG